MDRFHIVVFNYERITSFLDNFDKIKNFDPVLDRIYVLDCSTKQPAQEQKLDNFARERGWRLGEQVHFIKRKNWGIDQGARVDYLSSLCQATDKPKYIWQFQEHYLDLSSEWSWWPPETYSSDGQNLGGQLKGDTVPNGFAIDLNACEEVYDRYPEVGVIYADRLRIGVFTHEHQRTWFYTDGANFSIRTSYALQVFEPNILDAYRMIYDGTYDWALFLELDLGRKLTKRGNEWYDLVSKCHFQDPQSLKLLEADLNLCLHQNAEDFYGPLYRRYEKRKVRALSINKFLGRLSSHLSFFYIARSKINNQLKSIISRLGLGPSVRGFRRYLGKERR